MTTDPYADLVIPAPTEPLSAGPHLAARLTDGAAFILDETIDAVPLWGDPERILWAEGESVILTGTPGVGKTTLVQRLVLAMLRGGDVLGFPVSPRSRVLYLAMDRPRQIARSFRRMVTDADRHLLATGLVVWKGPPPADIARVPETLVTLGRAADADIIVIDSLKDAAIGLVDDTVGAAVNRAIQGTLAAGIDVCVLHHQTKRSGSGTGGRPRELADVYGSAWITAGAGSVILLHGDAGASQVELAHLKQPAEPVGPLTLEFDRHAGTIRLADTNVDPLDWLRHQRGPITAQHLAQTYVLPGDIAQPKHAQRARRDLDRLTREGLANKTPGTRGGNGGGTPDTYTATPHPADTDLLGDTP